MKQNIVIDILIFLLKNECTRLHVDLKEQSY